MPNRKSQSLVAQFVSEQIAKAQRPMDEIATQAGMSAKVFDLSAKGVTKLPIKQVDALAKALGVQTVYLLRLVLEDTLPESWSIIQDKLAELTITDYEQEILDGYRRLSEGRDISVVICKGESYVEVIPPSSR